MCSGKASHAFLWSLPLPVVLLFGAWWTSPRPCCGGPIWPSMCTLRRLSGLRPWRLCPLCPAGHRGACPWCRAAPSNPCNNPVRWALATPLSGPLCEVGRSLTPGCPLGTVSLSSRRHFLLWADEEHLFPPRHMRSTAPLHQLFPLESRKSRPPSWSAVTTIICARAGVRVGGSLRRPSSRAHCAGRWGCTRTSTFRCGLPDTQRAGHVPKAAQHVPVVLVCPAGHSPRFLPARRWMPSPVPPDVLHVAAGIVTAPLWGSVRGHTGSTVVQGYM